MTGVYELDRLAYSLRYALYRVRQAFHRGRVIGTIGGRPVRSRLAPPVGPRPARIFPEDRAKAHLGRLLCRAGLRLLGRHWQRGVLRVWSRDGKIFEIVAPVWAADDPLTPMTIRGRVQALFAHEVGGVPLPRGWAVVPVGRHPQFRDGLQAWLAAANSRGELVTLPSGCEVRPLPDPGDGR